MSQWKRADLSFPFLLFARRSERKIIDDPVSPIYIQAYLGAEADERAQVVCKEAGDISRISIENDSNSVRDIVANRDRQVKRRYDTLAEVVYVIHDLIDC